MRAETARQAGFSFVLLMLFGSAAALAESDESLIGKTLRPEAAQMGSEPEDLAETFFNILGQSGAVDAPKIQSVTVRTADPGNLIVDVAGTDFRNYFLVATILDEYRQPDPNFQQVRGEFNDPGVPLELAFSLPEDTPEGTEFSTAYLSLSAQRFGQGPPGMKWTYPLAKNWSVSVSPENLIITVKAVPEGTARNLPRTLSTGGGIVLPPQKTLKLKQTPATTQFRMIQPAATTAKPAATKTYNRYRIQPAQQPKTATKEAAPVVHYRVNPDQMQVTKKAQTQPVRLTAQQQLVKQNTNVLIAKLPSSRVYTGTLTGLKKEEVDKGAQGPSTDSIDILEKINIDFDLPVDQILSVRREILLDKNPASGVLYYMPNAYHLHWDADESYGFKMLYAADDSEGDSGRVLMAMQLQSGVSAREAALIRDLLDAYKKRHPGLVITTVRSLPITSEHPNVSLTDSLGAHFDIPEDKVVASVVSDALAKMNVSWMTDEVTKENIQLVLSQDIGISGSVTYTLASEDLSQITIPASVDIADTGTFGTMNWDRSEWRNPTPYPLRLHNLHMLIIEKNVPTIYSWSLGRSEIPPQARVAWDAADVPTWLDGRAKRMWIEYSVDRDCTECDRAVMQALTYGAAQASSRQEIVVRSLTPLADTGAIELGVILRSRYFRSTGDALETIPVVVVDEDRSERTAGQVYLIDRQPDEERADDPLYEYQLEVIMEDGTIHASPADRWIPMHRGRLLIGRVQVEQALGYLPGAESE